ncbi:hypothetical protein J4217_01540 [Candidatus Pacearchaeota archaeon]|nr:hypothetical protein [Candidatus Pacearchaeota archaeon]
MILDQPENWGGLENELVGTPTPSYDPQKAAEQLYQFIQKQPYETVAQFQMMVNEKPFVPYNRPAIKCGKVVPDSH